MEATNITKSSLVDFVKLIMGKLIHRHRPQRLLKTIKEKKIKRENLKVHIYIIYIYKYIKNDVTCCTMCFCFSKFSGQ